MKTIVATIKPWHLNNIRSGKKLWEIRKTVPKELPFKVLCCESGSGGRIVAEFTVKKYVDVFLAAYDVEWLKRMCAETCVTLEEARDYAGDNISKPLHFWKIENLIDYCSTKGYGVKHIRDYGISRVPQSWCYVKKQED